MAQATELQANKSVIFLAFANDRTEGGAYLRNLPLELDGIRKALQKARQAGLCEVVERSNTTVENILDVFQEYQDRIAIFHYAGHADSYELLLESLLGEHARAHSEGLVSFLAKQKGLQLIFLNGCCSQQQALDLIAAGLPAVIGTSQKIDDEVATNLSQRFYKGLAAGLSLDRAWAEAVDQIKVEKGTSNTRALHWKGKVETSDRFPWEIYYRPGAEIVKDWNLPEAVENPLFGLPEIPQTYDLPETPFLFLKRYERQHAEIFFGRSYHIRALYNRISDAKSDPIILLYGQSGVGKSSLFDAGLNPRLEKEHTVIYVRRIQEKGLLGTLASALTQEPMAKGEEQLALKGQTPSAASARTMNDEALRYLEAAADQAGEKLKQEIEALIHRLRELPQQEARNTSAKIKNPQPTTSDQQPASLLHQWQQLEARTGKPLLVILDQVEELYTRPNTQQPTELEVFLTALHSIFGSPAERPQGKLLLGYRKEYHPEIEEGFKAHRLPRATVFLESLRKKDILDIFHGLTRTPALKARYNLTVEEALPVMLADDLLEDKESPVAPVLQIVLTKLWKAALQENPTAPRFTVAQYEQLKQDGIAMGEFFAQQMAQLRTWQPEVVDSGLALDVLHFHTTGLGTAGTRSLEVLRQTYQHRQDIIDALIAKFKELYLLTEAPDSVAHTNLMHDTLAPVVTKEYNTSDRAGQRAVRILSNKITDFRENEKGVWLDEADLAVVEEGIRGMRRLSDEEQKLLEISRERKAQREQKNRLAKANVLTILANDASNTDNTKAIRLAQAAYGLVENDPPIPVKALVNVFDRRAEEPFYQKFQHADAVTSAVFSPNGQNMLTVSGDKTARLWSLTDNANSLAVFKHDESVSSAVFSPDGQNILTASFDRTARLWSLAGDSLAVFKHDGRVYSAVFSPDGQNILTASFDRTARLWSLAGDSLAVFKHGGRVNSAVFSPDGQNILTASGDKTARLWSLAGETLAVFKHGGRVNSAVFSPEGQNILTASFDKTARLWSLAGGPLVDFKHDGKVYSAAFSPDGQNILTASFDKTARLWSRAGDSLAVFKHGDTVYFAAFSPDGQKILTASFDKTARLWSRAGDSLAVLKHDGKVNSAVFSADGQNILTASFDDTARLWSLAGGPLVVFKHDGKVYSAVFSPDGQKILTASGDKTRRLWSLASDSLEVFKHDGAVYAAVFSPDGQKILTRSDDNAARLWSLAGNSLAVFKHDDAVYSAVFSPDGQNILTASFDKTARLWSLAGGPLVDFKHDGKVYAAVFSPDGQKILTRSDDNTARLWSLAGNSLAVFKHGDAVYFAVFSPDGQNILTASGDKTARLRLWSLAGDSLAVLKHDSRVNSAVFSPDGQKILTASFDDTARLWSLAGDSLAVFKHAGAVYSAVFSPDGQKILTASGDETARLWLTPKGLYEWLKTANIYQLSEQEKREYGIIEQ